MPRVPPLLPANRYTAPDARPVAGVLFLLASMWCLCMLDASGKWVMQIGVPLLVLCFARYLVHFFLVLGIVLSRRDNTLFVSKFPRLQCLRGLVMLGATITLFTALSYLPQAEATAIAFMAPLIMLAVAPFVLKEPARRSRWVAAACGFVGVLIVVRPQADLPLTGVLCGLLTALLFAAQHLITRLVARDDAMTTLLWSGAVGTLGFGVMMPFVIPVAWPVMQQIGTFEWCVMLSTGLSGGLGQLLQISAYRRAPASTLAPFIYLQIVVASIVGWLIWGVFPDRVTWLGIGIIAMSGVTGSLFEWRMRRRNRELR